MDDTPPPAETDDARAAKQAAQLQEIFALVAGIVLPGGFLGYAAYRVVKYKRWRQAKKLPPPFAEATDAPDDDGTLPPPR